MNLKLWLSSILCCCLFFLVVDVSCIVVVWQFRRVQSECGEKKDLCIVVQIFFGECVLSDGYATIIFKRLKQLSQLMPVLYSWLPLHTTTFSFVFQRSVSVIRLLSPIDGRAFAWMRERATTTAPAQQRTNEPASERRANVHIHSIAQQSTVL